MSGNRYDLGHYDQCVKLAYPFTEGQHCQLPLRSAGLESNPIFVMGVCVPAVCRESTLIQIMTPFFEQVDFNVVTNSSLHCYTDETESYGVLQWTVVGLLIALGVGLLFSTLYDVVKHFESDTPSLILNSFSLYRNTNALFDQPKSPESMTCLNGIRVLSMAWIVLYHAYQEYDSNFVIYNPDDIAAVNFINEFSL